MTAGPAILCVSPRISIQKGDFLGSGIPYWPLELAVLASALRADGRDVRVIDCFGSDPRRFSDAGDHWKQGRPIEEFRLDPRMPPRDEPSIVVVYAISYMSHGDVLALLRWFRREFPLAKLLAMENAQAVTAYSLARVADALFEAGADGIAIGDVWPAWSAVERALLERGAEPPQHLLLASRRDEEHVAAWKRLRTQIDRHPVPAWDLFPVEGYWSIPYAHGPKQKRFLPVLTSRGCPYPCDFCVVPETNDRRWRADDAVAVVDQFIELRDRFGVRDFHVEDLNPTVRSERWTAICEELLRRNAGIRFGFVSGTKAETVKLDQIELYAKAGCRFISISPESGSGGVMKSIGKPFDYDHGLALVAACRRHGIRTQACFLVGHPAETASDREASERYLRAMVRAGLDEAAIFIVAPFAGSRLFAQQRIELRGPLALPSFTPKGRSDFAAVEAARRRLIRVFFAEKLKRGLDLWMQGLRSLLGTPQTKMENLPRRILFVLWHTRLAALRGSASKERSEAPPTETAHA
jgi:radical SAM superfamily enzyme YgiQ (UPF0313 family)